jgi:DNA polymerase-4
LSDLGTIQSEVAKMAETAARWLEKRDTLARTVTLKIRYKDFRTITRAHSAEPTCDAAAIIDRAVRLVDKTDAGRTPVRLIGVSVSGLGGADEPPPEPAGEPRLPFE